MTPPRIDMPPAPEALLPEAQRAALAQASQEAAENGLRAPSAIVGSLLSTLAAASASGASQGAVCVTPAAGVVGLHILRGLPEKSTLTCIEPEAALQSAAKEAFKQGGYTGSRARFLTARPLDVLGRVLPEAGEHLRVGARHALGGVAQPVAVGVLPDGDEQVVHRAAHALGVIAHGRPLSLCACRARRGAWISSWTGRRSGEKGSSPYPE